jgi:hypothetical protein
MHMPHCCHIPASVPPVFPPSLIPDAERFSKFIGGAGPAHIGLLMPTTVLTSALHFEMKMWPIGGRLPRRYIPNNQWHNSWVAMLAGWLSLDQGGRCNDVNKIEECLQTGLPSKIENKCILTTFDEWHLKNMIFLRGTAPHGGGHPVPALASFGRCQKLINIYLKYEICWQVAGQWKKAKLLHYAPTRVPDLKSYLCALHAPIDRILLTGPNTKKGIPKTSFGLRGTALGQWLYDQGLISNNGAELRQSSNGFFAPWSQLDCLRTYYGFQLMLRKAAMHTWPSKCACDGSAQAAIDKCAKWFEQIFGSKHPCGLHQKDWVREACILPIDIIKTTLQEIDGANSENITSQKTPKTKATKEVEGGAGRIITSDKCVGTNCCGVCKVWTEITTNPFYSTPIQLPTMGGIGAELYYQFDARRNEIHVWRKYRSPNFWVNQKNFNSICQRYHHLLAGKLIPLPPYMGGAGLFTDPSWRTPPLGRINTPYVPPIIREVFSRNPGLMIRYHCCL